MVRPDPSDRPSRWSWLLYFACSVATPIVSLPVFGLILSGDWWTQLTVLMFIPGLAAAAGLTYGFSRWQRASQFEALMLASFSALLCFPVQAVLLVGAFDQ